MTEEQRKFKEAWMYHVRQLQALALQADVGYEKWMDLSGTLEAWIDATPTMQDKPTTGDTK